MFLEIYAYKKYLEKKNLTFKTKNKAAFPKLFGRIIPVLRRSKRYLNEDCPTAEDIIPLNLIRLYP